MYNPSYCGFNWFVMKQSVPYIVHTRMSNTDIESFLRSQPNKSNNNILGMDFVLLKESVSYMSESLVNVTNKSLKSGVCEQD